MTRSQVHAGYALFEIMFWQRSAAVAVPWNEMVFLGNVVSLLMAAAALVSKGWLALRMKSCLSLQRNGLCRQCGVPAHGRRRAGESGGCRLLRDEVYPFFFGLPDGDTVATA